MGTSKIFELRQYTLHPGQREVLIEVFDREFVESQEALGMEVVGQFRDLDRPDRFVWLRGFPDMTARRRALSAFYGGPVWAEHKDVANTTMVDFDDVLLLRPHAPDTAFPPSDAPRPQAGSGDQPRSIVTATVYRLAQPCTAELMHLFTSLVEPPLAAAGAARVALLQTEPAQNTYPALPVREDEHVLVRLARFDDAAAHAAHLHRLQSPDWQSAQRQLRPHLLAQPQQLRLGPTTRSWLR